MVYRIRPHASHLNHEIELEYRQAPGARGSWAQFVTEERPIPEEYAPVLILSERATPLPDAFEISTDFWCVSARVRDVMERLFGSQVAFYEVPVVVKATDAPLPATHFVTFSHFRSSIDWQNSKVRTRTLSSSGTNIEVINLTDVRSATLFKENSGGPEMIWIERTLREGNRLFSPGFYVYATNAATLSMSEAFPEIFILAKFDEIKTPTEVARQ